MNDVKKLPRWAQDHIRLLEREVRSLQEEALLAAQQPGMRERR